MTRGRKKDMTIPVTRALVQQRDYRARRAHYISDLEERVRKAEEENVRLRKELELARAGLNVMSPLLSNPQLAEASQELMKQLSSAHGAIDRFQHVINSQTSSAPVSPPQQLPSLGPSQLDHPQHLRPPTFPSPAPSPPNYQVAPQSRPTVLLPPVSSLQTSAHVSPYHSGRKRLYREDSPEPLTQPSYKTSRRFNAAQGSDSEPECCGGILDCRELVEEEDNGAPDRSINGRLSLMRSTSAPSSEYSDDVIRHPSTSRMR